MKNQNDTLKWIGWVIITLSLIILVLILLDSLSCLSSEYSCRWLSFVQWSVTTLIVLLSIWMIYNSYSKMLEILNRQNLEREKLKQEKDLDDAHNKFRIASDNNEYFLRKEAAKDDLLLKLVDKLSDREEVKEIEDGKEVKTIKLSFRKELLEEVKAIKLKWDEMKESVKPKQ
jgi:hypothetical protein